MQIETVKDILYIGGVTFAALSSFIGGIWWLSSVWSAIKENKKLREEDRQEIMAEITKLHTKIDRVENETRKRVDETHRLFSEIKEQIAKLEGKLEIFFKK